MKDGFTGSRAVIIPPSVVNDIERDEFCSMLHVTDIGYYPAAGFHKRKRPEGISQYVLIYCVSGQGWYKLGNKEFSVSANQCFILPASIPHSYGASKNNPWTIYWIHFKGTFAGIYAQRMDEPKSIVPHDQSRIYDRITVFEDMFNTLEMGYSKNNLQYVTSALYYFLGSIKFIETFRSSHLKRDAKLDVVDKAVLYMKDNLENQITIEQLSNYVGYSPSYFLRIFKAKTGYSPISYMIQLKIQMACQLLDFTEMKINQICHKIGIADPYYFSKLFSKTIGVSPTVYRMQKKG